MSSSLPTRRSSDRTGLHVRLQAALERLQERDPAAAGRALLLAAGGVVTLTAPLLQPDRGSWLTLAALTAGMTVVLLVSRAVPWSRLPSPCPLVFPALVWVALAVLGTADHGLAMPYVGLFVLCFAYTGLTQPARASLVLVPPAALAWLVAMGNWSTALGVRLVITVLVWVLLSQLLAGLTAQQRSLTDALRTAALTDPLTGLANRRDLEVRLAAMQPGDTVALLDLDHFKRLNDTLGHAAGDRVLADFGLLLRVCLRDGDHTARYGGEEFTVLLPGTPLTQAETALARLHERWAVLEPGVTFSAGLAHCSAAGAGAATLAAADEALYAAKAGGRDRDVSSAGVPLPASA